MRLIDADAMLEHLRKDPLFPLVEQYGLVGVIDALPTVDAVPVIRCCDCDNYKHWECPIEQAGYRPMGDMYCAWAVRRKNEID